MHNIMYQVLPFTISLNRSNFSMKVSVFNMARANKNQTAPTTNGGNNPFYAKCTICGVVNGFYDKGKKYDYITLDVPHGYDEYYDRFQVAISKNYSVPDDGETITLECALKTYKGNISIKEINADTQ